MKENSYEIETNSNNKKAMCFGSFTLTRPFYLLSREEVYYWIQSNPVQLSIFLHFPKFFDILLVYTVFFCPFHLIRTTHTHKQCRSIKLSESPKIERNDKCLCSKLFIYLLTNCTLSLSIYEWLIGRYILYCFLLLFSTFPLCFDQTQNTLKQNKQTNKKHINQ